MWAAGMAWHARHAANCIQAIQVISASLGRGLGGRRSPAVACWASDHWVASSNPLRGKFHH